ncbi:DUF3152 domain-containing protein [Streptomyces sp. NPDC091268]|uniref:DUF3152 domain-containing protein n=1 Tax=Streptomyces sp. NPDC091268 TaxID=3365979 RepID=UPI003811BDD5
MGRHSRKDPAPAPAAARAAAPAAAPDRPYEEPRVRPRPEPTPTVTHQGYVAPARVAYGARGGHPEQREPGGAWGAGAGTGAAAGARYGDWRGAPRDSDTPAFGTPAVGFPQVTLDPHEPRPRGQAHPQTPGPRSAPPRPAPDSVTSTGSHRRVPGPRKPADAAAAEPAADVAPRPGGGRGLKVRTYTGMAAAAVTAVLAVVVAGQAASDGDTAKADAHAAGDGRVRSATGQGAASRSDGRPTPDPSLAQGAAAPEQTYEQRMAQQLPIDEKLKGPGTFDTVPGVAPAPGKGKVVRYRVDVEQGLGLDGQLFAEAVHRTLNDDRSWGHGGTKSFERVPGGEADFVITLASPGTTGVWCAKSGLDTTVDNVSCDSASTDRVMINAYRWAQGSPTFGADQMLAYRQMLINHEVGHRLGHGHVNCRTPGALAPIMQQQTKSLDIGGIQCKPNPWVFPGS